MARWLLMPLILLSAGLHLHAEYRGPRWRIYLFKPLTTLLILGVALAGSNSPAMPYALWIVAGLVCSLAGDVWLMLSQDRFVAGLASFLLAHLCYLVALVRDAQPLAFPWLLLPLAIYGVALGHFLWPHLGKMRWAVLLYEVVILAMAWRAWERTLQMDSFGALLAAIGALLFVLSDSALAVNRFARRFHAAQLVVLGSYYLAQWLIALSV